MKKENHSSKKTGNMTTKPVTKHMQSIITALSDFVVGICANITNQDGEAEIRQAVLDHQDDLVKILKANFPAQKSLPIKKVKDPDAPKRGKSSYIYFCVEKRDKIKAANPDMSAKDIIKELGRVWREDTSDNDKARYAKMSADDKSRYEDEMKDYTPSNVDYVTEKKSKRSGPKRGLSAYIFFCKEHRALLKEEQPDLQTKDVTSTLGKRWRELSEDDRKPYNELAAADKDRYEKEKTSWVDPESGEETLAPKKSKKSKSKSKKSKSKKSKSKKSKSKKSKSKKSKSSKKEEKEKTTRRKSGYILYCEEKRQSIKEANEDMTNQQITKELGRLWKDLSDEEQAEYNDRAAN